MAKKQPHANRLGFTGKFLELYNRKALALLLIEQIV